MSPYTYTHFILGILQLFTLSPVGTQSKVAAFLREYATVRFPIRVFSMERDFSCITDKVSRFLKPCWVQTRGGLVKLRFRSVREKERYRGWCVRKKQCNVHFQNPAYITYISEALEICIALFTSLNISALLIPAHIPTVRISLTALDFCVISKTTAPF